MTFGCDRGGRRPDPSAPRQRSTASKRIECPFSVFAKENLDKSAWQLTHRPGDQYARHNHEPSIDIAAHPVHRQLSNTDISTITRLANAGVAPRDIRSYLSEHSATRANQQDIYNHIAQGKRDLKKGQSNIHALANELEIEGFWSRIRFDEDGRVTAVLFAHPASL